MVFAFNLAFASAGNSIPARIAMIAMTTSNSINVKADFSAPALEEPGWASDACFGDSGLSKYCTWVIFLQLLLFPVTMRMPGGGVSVHQANMFITKLTIISGYSL